MVWNLLINHKTNSKGGLMSKFQEAAKEAEKEIASPNEEEGSEELVKSSAERAQEPESEGETAGGQSDKERKPETQEFDPIAYIDGLKDKKLTPEQKKALKDGFLRQADYTRKTQEVAEARKLADEYKKYKPLLEKVLADEKLVQQALGIKEQEEADEDKPNYPQDPEEYAKWVEERAVNRMMEVSARETDLQNAVMLDERLRSTDAEDQNFQKIILGLISQDEVYKSGGKTATQATQDALDWYDEWQGQFIKKAQNDLTTKARSKTFVTQKTTAPNTVGQERPADIREAFHQAEAELAEKFEG